MTSDQSVSDSPVTQFAVLDALLAGAYESGLAVADVRKLGDFGIGCCEHLGGEVVILDGDVFECTVDDRPGRMVDDQVLPFVVACQLPAVSAQPIARADLAAFTDGIEKGLASPNLFHAVRVDGVFAAVRIRVTPRQERPFQPLAEVTSGQIETVVTDTRGTLVGFWTPRIYQGISVAGVHMHFISEDRSIGGHVLDVNIAKGHMKFAAHSRFNLRLPTDEHFLRTELTHDEDHRIVAVEGGRP
ncbi:acetolactate decarboxylase [Microbacterium sp. HD4P20]|uniref:acetolactate decarboxylase n=1 Tax=Microbacterium sp. HD4P20 TaxID=2864874 RepID=UPI001C644B24|nr:acetolactate decarboxylase [Microbacterium sp. HD4P20]MCP2635207.1 acetolactate decarboxylase [Microbacterium sp. HD4P20]